MNIRRRAFMQACGGTAGMSLVPGLASAWPTDASGEPLAQATSAQIEKSIKAGFGGGFVVYQQARQSGRVQATIGHADSRYVVVSDNLLDWTVVSGKS